MCLFVSLCVCLHVCVCLEIGLCCVAQAYYPASVSHSYDGRTGGHTHSQMYMVDFSYGVYIWRIS